MIRLSNGQKAQLNKFYKVLKKILSNNKQLADLKPRVLKFGSLINDLGTYESDIDLVVHFQAIPDNVTLDFNTSIIALETLILLLQLKLGIYDNERLIVPSRRCPILKLDFFWCFPKVKDWVS